MELVKVINTDKKYKAENGKEYESCNYYLVVNDNWIAIRPSFAKSYRILDLICRVVKNGKSK